MPKKTTKQIKKEVKPASDVKSIVSQVVEQLKPELKNHIENVRSDILADVQEIIKKTKVPQPNTSMDVSGLINGLKDGNMDLSQLAGLIPNMPTAPMAAMPKDLDPNQQLEFMKMQNQNQLMGMILPHLLKSLMPQQNDVVNQMMSRIFAEQMSSISINQRAQSMMMAKMAGSPELINQLNQNYKNLTQPLDSSLDKQAVQNGQGSGKPNP